MNVTREQILDIMPKAANVVDKYLEPLNAAMYEFNINTEKRIECFLAQIAHESTQLQCVEENLNYSATGLLSTFHKYFTPDQAAVYARHPERIANRVYANRNGNGDEASGDGWKHRGAGLIQLTFANNQFACADYFGVPREAIGDWLRTPEGACRSAAWFWYTHGCNALADADKFDAETRRINGGNNGADARMAFWKEAKEAIV